MDNVSISGRQNLAIAPVPQSQLFVGNHPWHFRLAVCDLLRIVLVIVSAAGAGQAAAVEVHLVPEQRQPNPTDHEQRSCRSGECYKGNGSFDYIRAHILALLPTPFLATGATRGGVPFGRGSLFYLLRNRFYIGEVKYKDETLPGEQPAIMDRALFDAVQQKLTDQWTTRSTVRNASDHLLTGLLFDGVGHRMVPTHAIKAGVRYRYYVSLPHLHGESKTASVGAVSRVPATDIENIIVKSLNDHLIAQKEKPAFSRTHVRDGKAALDQVARIDVHEDRLAVQLKSAHGEETSDAADHHLLSIPWQKPPSRKSRQILIPHGIPKNEIRPTRIERRARLVSAIARGRRWLDEIVSGSVTDIQQIATRQKCSVRQVNMTISLAFLAPDLVRAAVEGRLPRGIGVERLRDAPAEWARQFEALGLNPQ
jgi:site-specific DNA recombinase